MSDWWKAYLCGVGAAWLIEACFSLIMGPPESPVVGIILGAATLATGVWAPLRNGKDVKPCEHQTGET